VNNCLSVAAERPVSKRRKNVDTSAKKHHWKATIANRDGSTLEKDVFVNWDPEKMGESAASEIAMVGAAEHNVFVDRSRGPNGEMPWLPVSAVLLDA
jgi:hypothetical protein